MARKAIRRLTAEEEAGRKKRFVLFGCSGLLLVALIVFICVNVALHSGPALPRSVEKRAAEQAQSGPVAPGGVAPTSIAPAGAAPGGPAANPSIPAGTPPLRQQLEQLQYAGQVGDTRPQTLYISDGELNNMIAEQFKADENLKQVHAYFGTGKAYIVAVVAWKGQTLNVTVTTEPILVNGALQFAVQSVNVGSLGAPAAVTERIQREANKNKDGLSPSHTGLYADSVDVRDGVAILSGRAVRKTQ